MATAVLMPKQGQSVESCLIASWKKQPGDQVTAGETVCEVETDKALLEVESPTSGVVLALFFQEGDEVPVLTTIAAIGEPGEDVSDLRPAGTVMEELSDTQEERQPVTLQTEAQETTQAVVSQVISEPTGSLSISPRARNLAAKRSLDLAGLQGSGPGGRIIERDIQAVLVKAPPMTPLARTMVTQGGYEAPARGSGAGGRILARDLSAMPAAPAHTKAVSSEEADEVKATPVKGVRKMIAERMLNSLQTTAQLTLNTTADARALKAYRQRLKQSQAELGLQTVTINDLMLLAVSRTLLQYPELNARFADDTIYQYQDVHLGVAVDTPRGLMVPVIRHANTLSLRQLSHEAKRLATACLDKTIAPDELTGGTFTVTNLGSFGIETFTPVLNTPEVGILGVGNINLKPVEDEGEVAFIPHIGLSLTINHQVIDGAPAARFLQMLSQGLTELELLLAL
ncbi:MAG TPA: dihydrolipoamide acetyltransferase family protein [Anaerolineae bacterium]|jgi:pyruvate dehydrogenase E2 component (dihydrolipoamide acetyltransferase)